MRCRQRSGCRQDTIVTFDTSWKLRGSMHKPELLHSWTRDRRFQIETDRRYRLFSCLTFFSPHPGETMPARNLGDARIGAQIVGVAAMICLRPLITGFLRCPGARERSDCQCKPKNCRYEGCRSLIGCKDWNRSTLCSLNEHALMHQQAFPVVNQGGSPTPPLSFAPCLIMNEFSIRVKYPLIMNASRAA